MRNPHHGASIGALRDFPVVGQLLHIPRAENWAGHPIDSFAVRRRPMVLWQQARMFPMPALAVIRKIISISADNPVAAVRAFVRANIAAIFTDTAICFSVKR